MGDSENVVTALGRSNNIYFPPENVDHNRGKSTREAAARIRLNLETCATS